MMSDAPPHALVVGGSGMLRGVCLWLADAGWVVTVIGRDVARLATLESLARDMPGRVRGISVDYHDDAALSLALAESKRKQGPWSLVVLWIHSTAPKARVSVAKAAQSQTSVRIFDILGSAGARAPAHDWLATIYERHARIAWRRVVLGYVPGRDGSRWLSHAEVCAGVCSAIEQDADVSVVGTIEPWTARPG